MKEAFIAVDFGGGSGRVIAASIDHNKLTLDELHRFGNRQISIGGHLYWDFLSLFEEMKTGLRRAVEAGYRLVSVGIDTWGVDFGLIDRHGNLLGNPVCYRDPVAVGGVERYFKHNDISAHYAEAGIQIMDINTLYPVSDPHLRAHETLMNRVCRLVLEKK
ncbi:MAG: rhamnulokinase, partial [Muribaculaceae bacterium]|nr:rhamnulokinase [Muribaculaceae bacterium]